MSSATEPAVDLEATPIFADLLEEFGDLGIATENAGTGERALALVLACSAANT
jgi:hypothetical protein